MIDLKRHLKEEQNEQLRSTSEWRSLTEKDITEMRDVLKGEDLVKTDMGRK